MRIRHSKAYELLAVKAGELVSLAGQITPDAVAKDSAARQQRDALWEDYELRLRDTQTYTVRDIEAWLKDQGCDTGKSSVHRDREALTIKERSYSLAAQKSTAVMKAISEAGQDNLLRGGQMVASQLLFEALCNLEPTALEGMTPGQTLKMIDTLSFLRKSVVDSDLLEMKLKEKTRDLKAETDKACKAAPDKKLTRRAVFEMIDRVMKGEAA